MVKFYAIVYTDRIFEISTGEDFFHCCHTKLEFHCIRVHKEHEQNFGSMSKFYTISELGVRFLGEDDFENMWKCFRCTGPHVSTNLFFEQKYKIMTLDKLFLNFWEAIADVSYIFEVRTGLENLFIFYLAPKNELDLLSEVFRDFADAFW